MKLGLLNILTIIFVFCKIFEVGAIAHWSWWLVFAPSLIGVGIFFVIMFFVFIIALITAD